MRKNRLKNTMALTLSFLLLSSSPGGQVYALFAQQINTAATGKTGVRVAPIALNLASPMGADTFARQGMSFTGLNGTLPGFELTAGVPKVRHSGSVIPMLPAPFVHQAAPSASVSAPIVSAVEKVATGEGVGAAAAADNMSGRIKAAIESVGPVKEAADGPARGLGQRLSDIIQGKFRAERSGVPAGEPLSLGSPKEGLNASGGDGSKSSQAATKKAMIQTLDYIASIFSGHYAPLEWKGEKFDIQLKVEYGKAKQAIAGSPYITTKEFQNILAGFVASLRDFHAGIQFYSTEAALLPINIAGAEGKYYLTNVDRRALPEAIFPFQPGDQVIEFDGRPVGDVVAELRREKGKNAILTDTDLAELRLTRRIRQGGDLVPEGPVKIRIRTKDGKLHTVKLAWMHVDEMVPQDIPIRDAGDLIETDEMKGEDFELDSAGSRTGFAPFKKLKEAVMKLLPLALNPLAKLLGQVFPQEADNPFAIGAKKSFVPELGEVLWRAPAGLPFEAYIYKTAEGKRVGFVRIASFMMENDDMAAEVFGQLMQMFEEQTDGLVIDQVNNPGGSVFFLYALISRLIDKPIKVPKHRIIVGEADAIEAAQIIQLEQFVKSDMDAMRVLGPSMGGYPVTLALFQGFVKYAKTVMAELRAGNRLTQPVGMMGLEEITPHPTQRYTKPIKVLINPLDFSAADFFPAILQDAGRAKTFGSRTSGAGGAVKAEQFANQFGIAMLAYTWTIAIRPTGKPIEDLGVTPDESYRIKAVDLEDSFSGYKKALNEAVRRMVKDAPARAEPKPAEEDPAQENGKGAAEPETPPMETEDPDPKKEKDPDPELPNDGDNTAPNPDGK